MTDATSLTDNLNIIQRIRRDYSPLVIIMVGLFLIVFVAGTIFTDDFLTWFNIKTIIRDAALVGIMAIGLTFVTLPGNFFLLSMKEIAALSIICFATLMSADWNQWSSGAGDPATSALLITFLVAFGATMIIATIAGALQGALIGLGGNPIVVTLGAAGLFFGIGSWWSDNLVVSYRRPHGAEWLGSGSFIGTSPTLQSPSSSLPSSRNLRCATPPLVARYTWLAPTALRAGRRGMKTLAWRSSAAL